MTRKLTSNQERIVKKEVCYTVKFYDQACCAYSVEELVEKIQKHKDAIPFRIFKNNTEIFQWRKYRGLESVSTKRGNGN
jgi:hypothetical protein